MNASSRPQTPEPRQIGVIGAGLSGLAAARQLQEHGHRVHVFEKSRGVGGRMATRRQLETAFDHGAQYFTARSPQFGDFVRSLLADNQIGVWPARGQKIVSFQDGNITEVSQDENRYVGVPGMNQLCKQLSQGLAVQREVRILEIHPASGVWHLRGSDQQYGPFDAVLISAPSPQTAELIGQHSPLGILAAQCEMYPCWAAMVLLDEPLPVDWVGAFLNDSILSWCSLDQTKPGRPSGSRLILHANHQWSRENLEQDANLVGEKMLQQFWQITQQPRIAHRQMLVHRWRYAIPESTHQDSDKGSPLWKTHCGWDEQQRLGFCGDWCSGGRVEGAFLSGQALAEHVHRHFQQPCC